MQIIERNARVSVNKSIVRRCVQSRDGVLFVRHGRVLHEVEKRGNIYLSKGKKRPGTL